MKCECCGLVEAQVKDYRSRPWGSLDKYFVCHDCMHLSDELYFDIMRADGVRKDYLLRQIIDEDEWEKYGIEPPEDEKIMSWNLQLFWNDGDITTLGDMPDDVAQTVDDYLTEKYGGT